MDGEGGLDDYGDSCAGVGKIFVCFMMENRLTVEGVAGELDAE